MANSDAKETEILPDDIVEMRYDQIKLANIDTGSIDMRSINNILKVNGKVSVAPRILLLSVLHLGDL